MIGLVMLEVFASTYGPCKVATCLSNKRHQNRLISHKHSPLTLHVHKPIDTCIEMIYRHQAYWIPVTSRETHVSSKGHKKHRQILMGKMRTAWCELKTQCTQYSWRLTINLYFASVSTKNIQKTSFKKTSERESLSWKPGLWLIFWCTSW